MEFQEAQVKSCLAYSLTHDGNAQDHHIETSHEDDHGLTSNEASTCEAVNLQSNDSFSSLILQHPLPIYLEYDQNHPMPHCTNNDQS